jgi:hypothetical protein
MGYEWLVHQEGPCFEQGHHSFEQQHFLALWIQKRVAWQAGIILIIAIIAIFVIILLNCYYCTYFYYCCCSCVYCCYLSY